MVQCPVKLHFVFWYILNDFDLSFYTLQVSYLNFDPVDLSGDGETVGRLLRCLPCWKIDFGLFNLEEEDLHDVVGALKDRKLAVRILLFICLVLVNEVFLFTI